MRLRAVIYARCSTEEESQKDALAKQAAEARECVEKNGWLLAGSYIESRSGTSTKGRAEYNRLYEDLAGDKFDIIVIKSQDRLMRNTKDWYLFVDRLTASQKRLYIYIEQKFYSTDDALITGIKAILAEDYSRELSKKLNNAHQNRQKNGGTVLLTNRTYGYRKLPDKSVELVEEEAKTKRRMYELCAAGYGSRAIAKLLWSEGVVNRKGNPFSDADIRRMIRNPLNKGTVVMHRTHYDFDSGKTLKVPEEEWFVYENKVPAIVPEELWELANEAISRRAGKASDGKNEGRGRNPGKPPLGGKLVCGLCGAPFYRTTRKRYKDKTPVHEWNCRSYLQGGKKSSGERGAASAGAGVFPGERGAASAGAGVFPGERGAASTEPGAAAAADKASLHMGCDNVHIKEEILYNILKKACIHVTQSGGREVIARMMKLLERVLDESGLRLELEQARRVQEQIKTRMNTLVDKLLAGVIADEAYREKQNELEEGLGEALEKCRSLEQENAGGSAVLAQRLSAIEKFLREGEGLEKAALAQLLEEVDKIRIYPDHLELSFRWETIRERGEMPGVPGIRTETADVPAGCKLRLDFGNTFDYAARKRQERERVAQLMKANPTITAGRIAEALGISLSGANYKIRALKKEGRIRFNGSGGKGCWEVR